MEMQSVYCTIILSMFIEYVFLLYKFNPIRNIKFSYDFYSNNI